MGGEEIFVDPGTFAYHTEPEWRAYFRGTSAHNTLRVDGLDQSQPGGNFMWLRKAQAASSAWMTSADQDFLEAWHDGYMGLDDPVMHRRRTVVDKRARTVLVEDYVQMDGTHELELFFHCAEGSRVQAIAGGVSITRAGRTIRLRWPDLPGSHAEVLEGRTAPIAGWVSRRLREARRPHHSLARHGHRRHHHPHGNGQDDGLHRLQPRR